MRRQRHVVRAARRLHARTRRSSASRPGSTSSMPARGRLVRPAHRARRSRPCRLHRRRRAASTRSRARGRGAPGRRGGAERAAARALCLRRGLVLAVRDDGRPDLGRRLDVVGAGARSRFRSASGSGSTLAGRGLQRRMRRRSREAAPGVEVDCEAFRAPAFCWDTDGPLPSSSRRAARGGGRRAGGLRRLHGHHGRAPGRGRPLLRAACRETSTAPTSGSSSPRSSSAPRVVGLARRALARLLSAAARARRARPPAGSGRPRDLLVERVEPSRM